MTPEQLKEIRNILLDRDNGEIDYETFKQASASKIRPLLEYSDYLHKKYLECHKSLSQIILENKELRETIEKYWVRTNIRPSELDSKSTTFNEIDE